MLSSLDGAGFLRLAPLPDAVDWSSRVLSAVCSSKSPSYFRFRSANSSSVSSSARIILSSAVSIEWINSSSLRCIANASRFWVFWIKKTMRKVMMVVVVLMTSCQVSEKSKMGPLTPQTTMSRSAAISVS